MPKAYVLINVEAGSEEEVLNQLTKIEGIEESYLSYGVYDLITKVQADTMEKLKDVVAHKIRALNQIRSTLTLILTEQ